MTSELSSFLGTDVRVALHGGSQSVVLEAVDRDGARCVAKLRDTRSVNADNLATRMEVMADLSAVDSRIVAPLARSGVYVTEVPYGDRTMLGTLFPFVDGSEIDHNRASDASLMGVELARLHDSLAILSRYDLPLVPALSVVDFRPTTETLQLLHGDFSDQNVRNDGGALHIFDFDDCGYGPREFDVANSLYMVLFEQMVEDHADGYEDFEERFLDGYLAESGEGGFALGRLTEFVGLRVEALQAWLEDLPSAPAGIRDATPQWHDTLRRFVDRYWDRSA